MKPVNLTYCSNKINYDELMNWIIHSMQMLIHYLSHLKGGMQWGRAGLTQQGNNDLNILFWILHDEISNKKKFRPLNYSLSVFTLTFKLFRLVKFFMKCFYVYLLYNCCCLSQLFISTCHTITIRPAVIFDYCYLPSTNSCTYTHSHIF